MWENINYPKKKKLFRLLLGWGLTALFIAAITGIFYGILHTKSLQTE
jgi:hypothetical protein